VVAEHHPLASRYTLLSAHCLFSVLCVTDVYNNVLLTGRLAYFKTCTLHSRSAAALVCTVRCSV